MSVNNSIKSILARLEALEAKINEEFLANFIEGEMIATFAVTDMVGEDRVYKLEERIAALEKINHK